MPNINYEILLEGPKLEEGTINEETIKELKEFSEPYIDCGECIKKFEYDIFEDCPEVRKEAEKKLAEEPVGAWKKNPPLRFCLAKIIDERVRKLEEKGKEKKRTKARVTEEEIAAFADCGKCRKKNKINIITDYPMIEEEVEKAIEEENKKRGRRNG